jgi:hypothetical protein
MEAYHYMIVPAGSVFRHRGHVRVFSSHRFDFDTLAGVFFRRMQLIYRFFLVKTPSTSLQCCMGPCTVHNDICDFPASIIVPGSLTPLSFRRYLHW